MTDEELQRLRARASRALDGVNLDDLFSQWRAVIGPPPEEMSQLAREAREELKNLASPTPEQLQALEYAIRLLRPAPLVTRGAVEALPPATAAAFPAWEGFRTAVQPYIDAVGRIDRPAVSGYDGRPVGTGFLISDRCLVTNRHVLELITLDTGVLVPGQAVVRFRRRYSTVGVAEPDPVSVVSIIAAHPDLDLAVLAIEEPPSGVVPITVDPDVSPEDGTAVAAIGYPTDDGRNPAWVLPLFADMYGVERVAPGEVTRQRPGRLYHDCTTLGGNSGSPVMTLDGARLAGVHASGMFLASNHAICGEDALSFLAGAA